MSERLVTEICRAAQAEHGETETVVRRHAVLLAPLVAVEVDEEPDDRVGEGGAGGDDGGAAAALHRPADGCGHVRPPGTGAGVDAGTTRGMSVVRT